MAKVWRFFKDPKNLAALTALAGVLAFLWSKFEPKAPEARGSKPETVVSTQEAHADGKGHAVNASGGSSVSIGAPASLQPPPIGSAPKDTAPVNQTATAKEGHAVNASQNAAVQITEAK